MPFINSHINIWSKRTNLMTHWHNLVKLLMLRQNFINMLDWNITNLEGGYCIKLIYHWDNYIYMYLKSVWPIWRCTLFLLWCTSEVRHRPTFVNTFDAANLLSPNRLNMEASCFSRKYSDTLEMRQIRLSSEHSTVQQVVKSSENFTLSQSDICFLIKERA